ncbi:Rab effector Noc2 [Sciurus carolinensis]|uniref:Rab effector Noc2 n=1 Tax=Sciurus carolinensis TaxID=30640 RepID=A0AA41TA93_SCICA|nr:Rab effector Noc2 [Sciurus carolinensis]
MEKNLAVSQESHLRAGGWVDCAEATVGGGSEGSCSPDLESALSANLRIGSTGRLQTGWSVHTYQTEKQRRSQSLSPAEVDAILQVIQRAERLDVMEQQRIGRLVERLETMRRNVMGNGLSQCLLCGEVLGFLGSSSVFCKDCRKKVCTKCGIETSPGQKRPLWLCKICSEQREVWKRSGAWFYKGLPKYILPLKTPGRADDPHFRPLPVEPAEPEPRSTEVSRIYTWARGRGKTPWPSVPESSLMTCRPSASQALPGCKVSATVPSTCPCPAVPSCAPGSPPAPE